MTGKLIRQILVPGALLIVVGIVLLARPDNPPASIGVSPIAPVTRKEALPPNSAVADVRLELLNRADETMSLSDRNPFRFAAKPPPPFAAVKRLPPPPPEPVWQGPPPPPPIPLRFIGVIETPQRAGGRVAIFSDGRGAVMYGKEGEIIEGRYRLLRMGSDSVELAYADGRGRQTIRLSGQ